MKVEAYRDVRLSVEARTEDLLGRMTLAEKVGQMMQGDGRGELKPLIVEQHHGSLLHILNHRLDEAMDLAGRTRLGIPLLIGEDGIHGHSFHAGATIFPTQLGMASTWNPELLERMARAAAREMACTGMHWTFSPVLCIARDLRWGRVGETFGEDGRLIGIMAEALIRGYQGKGLNDPEGVLATAKHYAGYSETQGGRDASEADLSRRKLRAFFLPPFERAARAGCMAFMTGYQSIEGVPSTANRWLLREVLKEEWGFEGILVTDWDNVGRMVWEQRVCADLAEASALAVRAGNDLIMSTPGFFEAAQEAVRRGLLDEEEIDAVVRRILRLKFRMGLFENPRRPDYVRQREVIACASHQELNLEVARQSVVLLRNEGGLLPLDGGLRKILVTGPAADDPLMQLGDWSLGSGQVPGEGHPRECTVTVLDGLRMLAPKGCEVVHVRGCSAVDPSPAGVDEAVAAARGADVIVAVVGDAEPFIGECKSTATLELMGGQVALLEGLAGTGVPMVVVLVHSKPQVLPRAALEAAGLLEAFNPGMQGGRAVAEILFGMVNPSGRLPISVPRHVGQQPVYYSQVRGQHGDRYADLTQEPQFRFGAGLSYTRFELEGFAVEQKYLRAGQGVRVKAVVRNTGARPGGVVVRVLIEDVVTSVTWVNHALAGFQRVELDAGEAREVGVEVPADAFTLVNAAGCRVVEPGVFRLAGTVEEDPAMWQWCEVTVR